MDVVLSQVLIIDTNKIITFVCALYDEVEGSSPVYQDFCCNPIQLQPFGEKSLVARPQWLLVFPFVCRGILVAQSVATEYLVGKGGK